MKAEDVAELLEERALADDLADVLSRVVTAFGVKWPEHVGRVLARYREARGTDG